MAFPWLAMLPMMIQAGTSLAASSGTRRAGGEVPTLQPYLDALARADRYAQAAGDSEDPFFKDLQADRTEQNRRASMDAVLRIMRMNARDRARGGAGFGINPERRDESRAAALAEAFQNAKLKSRLEARDTLLRLSENARLNAAGYTRSFPLFREFGDIQANQRASRAEGIGDLAGGLFGLFRDRPTSRSIIAPPMTDGTPFT